MYYLHFMLVDAYKCHTLGLSEFHFFCLTLQKKITMKQDNKHSCGLPIYAANHYLTTICLQLKFRIIL